MWSSTSYQTDFNWTATAKLRPLASTTECRSHSDTQKMPNPHHEPLAAITSQAKTPKRQPTFRIPNLSEGTREIKEAVPSIHGDGVPTNLNCRRISGGESPHSRADDLQYSVGRAGCGHPRRRGRNLRRNRQGARMSTAKLTKNRISLHLCSSPIPVTKQACRDAQLTSNPFVFRTELQRIIPARAPRRTHRGHASIKRIRTQATPHTGSHASERTANP